MLLPCLLCSHCAETLPRPQPWPWRPSLTESPLSTGRADPFTINCSGFDQHGVDPAAFQAVFDRKAFRPVINYSIPTHVNISFTLSAILEVVRPGPHFLQLLIGHKDPLSCRPSIVLVQWWAIGTRNGFCINRGVPYGMGKHKKESCSGIFFRTDLSMSPVLSESSKRK